MIPYIQKAVPMLFMGVPVMILFLLPMLVSLKLTAAEVMISWFGTMTAYLIYQR